MHLGKNTNDLLLSLLLLIGHSEWASRYRWPIRQMYNSRAFTFGIFKLFYFTISKVTLSIIPYYFTIHPTS